jgi:penicillin-binding protein 1C
VRARWLPSDALLLDRHGQPLGSKRIDRQGRRGAWVRLADTSPALPQALLAAEDKRYAQHAGVDWLAVAAALWQQMTPPSPGARPRGASSITMQVAAMLDDALARPGGPRPWPQKWQQIEAALALERHWRKDQILEAYLNLLQFRGEWQGLAAASQGLFGKAPSGLDHEESALLAALVRAPNAVPALVARRACAVLAQTRPDGGPCDAAGLRLTLEHAGSAAAANPRLETPLLASAPHTAQRLLRPGAAAPALRSSLDADIQRLAQDALAAQLAQLWSRGVEDGAVVVLHNRSGEVLAHVGSGGRYSRAAMVDAADAPRQAGSTLKPLIYAVAFDRLRLQPATLLDDSPLALPTDAGLYTPQNYDQQFSGPVSVRRALASSLNIPAVRALQLAGAGDVHRLLKALDFAHLEADPALHGPALALGAADVTLLQLANAYRMLANGGVHGPLHWLPSAAVDPAAAADPPAAPRRLLSAEAAWLVGHVLADNAARAPTFGPDSVLATPVWTAVKTGTSKDMRDNWCIGWSADYTVGVWVGHAGGAPMRDVSGVSGAAPAWAQVMRGLHRRHASAAPPPPAGVQSRAVRFEAGIEATRLEWFMAAAAPPGQGLHSVALASGGRPRIIAPVDGTLLAWDPDIPAPMQALVARSEPAAPGLQWWLNDRLLATDRPSIELPLAAPGGPRTPVALQAGPHRLALRTADGTLLDQVRFELRGLPRRAEAPPADQAASNAENSGSALPRGR